MSYKLVGYDQFSHEEYRIATYETLDAARVAKSKRIKDVVGTQYASLDFHDKTYIKDENGRVVD